MKEKTLFLSLGLLMVNYLYGQEGIVAVGGDASGNIGSFSYSIGQIVYTPVSGNNGSSNQGIQQPYEFFNGTSGIVDANPNLLLVYKVYPNPSNGYVILSVSDEQELKNLRFQLYDISGKKLSENQIIYTETMIPMEEKPAGNYFLKIIKRDAELKTFKIIKH